MSASITPVGGGRYILLKNITDKVIMANGSAIHPGHAITIPEDNIHNLPAGLVSIDYGRPIDTSTSIIPSMEEPYEILTSVVIPTYNRTEYLRECVNSIAPQMDNNVEIIIVDDYSEEDIVILGDNTRYIRMPERSGIAKSRNMGVSISKARGIIEIDSDDLMLPGAIEEITAALDDCDFVFSHIEEFSGDERRVNYRSAYRPGIFFAGSHTYGIRAYRRSVWRAIGGHNEELPAAVDLDFSIRAEEAGARFQRIDKILASYRIHDGQVSQSMRETQKACARKIIREAKERRENADY